MTTVPLPPSIPDAPVKKSTAYTNREVSWLDFNERVLELANDTDVPLLERAKFLAIFAGNLDEFFMVRVAGVHDQIEAGIVDAPRPDGPTPGETLETVSQRARGPLGRHGPPWGGPGKPQPNPGGGRSARPDRGGHRRRPPARRPDPGADARSRLRTRPWPHGAARPPLGGLGQARAERGRDPDRGLRRLLRRRARGSRQPLQQPDLP